MTTWNKVWVTLSTWARTASITCGWPWPTFITPIPPAKSMYRRPATSQSSAPLARSATITDLSGGITNRNYRVDVGGSSYVLRVGGKDTDLLGIDRSTEHAASLRAAEVGVGPEVIDFLQPEGWLVTRFIQGRSVPPNEIRTPDGIQRVARVLQKIHGAAPIPGRFDAHAVVEEYRNAALAHGVRIPVEFDEAHRVSKQIRRARGRQP